MDAMVGLRSPPDQMTGLAWTTLAGSSRPATTERLHGYAGRLPKRFRDKLLPVLQLQEYFELLGRERFPIMDFIFDDLSNGTP